MEGRSEEGKERKTTMIDSDRLNIGWLENHFDK